MPFSSKCNYTKLKTNLRLTINRLKLLEKKKTELALKARKEIADYIMAGKEDRARIRVEHIIREDYMVEGMEIIEMFCDLLLARFGIIEKVASLDPSLEEAIASIMWVEPRLSADVPELSIICKNLEARYGKEYHMACKANTLNNVNEKLMRKMNIFAPPQMLIENYMVAIAKSFNVEFTPDPIALLGADGGLPLGNLLAFDDEKLGFLAPPGAASPPLPSVPACGPASPPRDSKGGPGGGGSGGGGGMGFPAMDYPPSVSASMQYPPPNSGMQYPPPNSGMQYPPPNSGMQYPPPNSGMQYPPPNSVIMHPPAGSIASCPDPSINFSEHSQPPSDVVQAPNNSPPRYSTLNLRPGAKGGEQPTSKAEEAGYLDLPEIPSNDLNLPSVPSGGDISSKPNSDDIDFDDLTSRFENLKKRK